VTVLRVVEDEVAAFIRVGGCIGSVGLAGKAGFGPEEHRAAGDGFHVLDDVVGGAQEAEFRLMPMFSFDR